MKPISKRLVACALVVAFSLLSTHALAIEIDFAPGVVIGGGANGDLIIDMEPFDFDQDGDVDLVGITGNFRDALNNNIDLFLNSGDDVTFTNVVLASSRTPRQVTVADINDDGWMDILYTDLRNGRVFWHENQFGSGSGFSGQRSAVTSAWWADGLGIGDLDGDGDLDIAFTIRNNGDVRWIANQLNEPNNNDFSSMRTIGRGIGNARQAAIADINADGKLDVVVGGGESNGSLVWYDNTDGLGSAWVVNTIDAGNFTCINPQDFDEDGNIDLVVQENNSSANPGQRMAVWLNTTGDGLGFTEQVISTNIGRDAYDNCEMADLDFDGDFDFVGNSDGEWFDNIDGSVFTLRNFDSSSGDTDHQSMRLMDIDGDGDQDIFTAQFDRERFTYYENEFCNAGDPDFDLDGIPDACDDQIVIDDVTVSEGDSGITTVTFTVTLQIDLRGNVSYATRAGSATAGDDYASTNGTLAFVTGVAGESFTVSVDVNGDTDPEVPETFFLDLQSSDFVTNDDVGTATILNDDGTSISIDDASISEGDSGQTDLVFTVSLAVETAAFTVPFSTSDGSALAASDYIAQSGTLSFDGTTGETQTISVPITGDTFVENDENFFVTLGAPSDTSVAVLDDTGEGTILNDETASVSIFDAGFDEADVGDGTLDFIVELSGSTNFPFQVNFETNDGTATAGSDYNDNDGSLSFSGNDGEQRFIRVTVIDDDILEDPETVLAMLTGTSNPAITIATADATGTISDDDRAELAIQNSSVIEGDSGERSLVLDVQLNGGVQGGFSVAFSTADNTALAGSDYTATSDTLTFVGTGGEVQTISIPVTGDSVVETDETFLVNLGTPSNSGVTVENAQATATITNDDSASIAITNASVAEGDSGETTLQFGVTLTGTVQDGFSVDFASTDGTAAAGSDYTTVDDSLSFTGNDGEVQTISVPVTGDTVLEADETFLVDLATPSNTAVTVSTAQATATIENDDAATLTISDQGNAESSGSLTFTVQLTGEVDQAFSVDFATADDTAVSTGEAADFTSNSGTLNFAGTADESQTIEVTLLDDAILESDETFTVSLSNLSDDRITFGDQTATGQIGDDDQASIAITDTGGLEGDADNTFTITVTLTGGVQDGFSVDYSSSDDDAEAGNDYTEANGTLNFSGTDGETQTLDVTILGDEIVENDETFVINLDEPSNTFVARSDAEANVVIANDDNAEISIADVSVDEGNSGTTAAEFVVSVSAAVQDGFAVDFATADDSATAGSDYESNTGQITFDGNLDETQTITVSVIGDEDFEADETFFVNLLSTSNKGQISFSDSQAVGTIANDDSGVRDCISVAAGNWSTPETWSCDGELGPPDEDDNVTLDSMGTVSLDTNVLIESLNANANSALSVDASPFGLFIECTSNCNLQGANTALSGGLTLTSINQDTSVGNVDGAFELTLVSGSEISIVGDLGGTTPLANVDFLNQPISDRAVQRGGPTLAATGSITTNGDLDINRPLFMTGDLSLNAPNVDLASVARIASRGAVGTEFNLSVDTPGTLDLDAPVGSEAMPLSSFTVTGGGIVDIDFGRSVDQIYTSGGQIYEAELVFDNNTQLNAGFIEFRNPFTINVDLTLNVSGFGSLSGSLISAPFSGSSPLTKTGSGMLTIESANTHSGEFIINDGAVRVSETGSTSAASTITLNNGALGGDGSFAGTIFANGGNVTPGNSPGVLNTGALMLESGATFTADIDGLTTAGTDYDQLNVTGTVTIDNATLEIDSDLVASGTGAVITLIENDGTDPVVGTFADLPEGAFVINNGPWQISYSGGDGNDVVLIDNEGIFSDGFEQEEKF